MTSPSGSHVALPVDLPAVEPKATLATVAAKVSMLQVIILAAVGLVGFGGTAAGVYYSTCRQIDAAGRKADDVARKIDDHAASAGHAKELADHDALIGVITEVHAWQGDTDRRLGRMEDQQDSMIRTLGDNPLPRVQRRASR